MSIDSNLTAILFIVLFVVSYIIVFLLGLFIGISYSNRGVSNNSIFHNKVNKNTSPTNSGVSISIDDTKFVTEIKTDGMEKKFETIGDTKNSTDNISNSIAKLKNLKG